MKIGLGLPESIPGVRSRLLLDWARVIFTAADAETARKLIQLVDPSKSTRIDAHGGKSTFLISVSN